ncbi:MAG TPA: hypothetical protein GX722_02705 [Clostridiales bacterium]|nr:hypothetical protein [Clostridiales bacterium]
MDLLKTFLVYMAVLVTSSVQMSPAFTPVPPGASTPVPTATVAPAITLPPATQAPATQTPSASTSYTTLYVGDRGDNVRVMQLRLKELGYLTGKADGIFGQQTRRAVERFQYYNNLKTDGIAGPKTLAKLYTDPNVVVAPAEVPHTPTPTKEPAPTLLTIQVPVRYQDTNGKLLFSDSVLLQPGRTTIHANNARVPVDYVLTGASSVTVSVASNGVATPAMVVFTYRAPANTQPPQSINIPVYYQAQDGTLLGTAYVSCFYGRATVIYAQNNNVPSGYTLVSPGSVTINVSQGGVPTPSSATFTYRAPAPQQVVIPITYKDTNGETLHTTSATLNVGTNTISANDSLVPKGYTLKSARTVSVSVSTRGVATPASVTFEYTAPPAVVTATITVYYKDEGGAEITREVSTYTEGTHTVKANSGVVPAGYTLVGSDTASITVAKDGSVTPASVTFTYKAPVTATIPITYQDTKGETLFTENRTLKEGTHNISADDSRAPQGYVLTGTRDVAVTVAADGKATPDSVVFTYKAPVTASISIAYQDTKGGALSSDTRTLKEGANTVTADDSKVPAGYVLKGERSITVTVASDGTATPSSVTFIYQAPISVQVGILYRDEQGAELGKDSFTARLGKNTVTANDSKVPQGYLLTSARSVEVTVNEDETATPSAVEFIYKAPLPPVQVNVPIIYVDDQGTQLNTDSALAMTGNNTVTADASKVPQGYILVSDRSVNVVISPEGTATPEQVTFTYRAPTPMEQIKSIPEHQSFTPVEGMHPVYTGPGTHYFRAGGNAAVGGGKCRYYGNVGEWALIGYGLSNGQYRIGYVQQSALPADVSIRQLQLGYAPVTTTGSVYFTDDPIIGTNPDANRLAYYGEGGVSMHLLAWFGENWAYVEISNFNGDQPARGFVVRRKL